LVVLVSSSMFIMQQTNSASPAMRSKGHWIRSVHFTSRPLSCAIFSKKGLVKELDVTVYHHDSFRKMSRVTM
jgi:hypothetical protein